jgi:predicted amidophosphoribosyltransferase
LLQDDWKELVDGQHVDLSGDACPACGCALPLVAGACADCGLQLED